MNFNARLSRIQAFLDASKPPPPDPEQEARRREWVQELAQALGSIVEKAPAELQGQITERLLAGMEDYYGARHSPQPDALLLWGLHLMREDYPPLPPAVPREVYDIYIRDPKATPWDECPECGMQLPAGDFYPRSYFTTCPVCHVGKPESCGILDGQVKALKALDLERLAWCHITDPEAPRHTRLSLLTERGWRPGVPLSRWAEEYKRRQAEGSNP